MTRCINFSGGRSSALMLHRYIQQGLTDRCPGDRCPGDRRPSDRHPGEENHVVFTNTGMEREETLRFIQDCSDYWKVPIIWIEYQGNKQYGIVDYRTASRRGEPYEKLIAERRYLPNRVARFCTGDLKVKACKWYMQQVVGASFWHSALGIRYDEPLRWGKLLQQKQKDPWYHEQEALPQELAQHPRADTSP